MAVDGARQRSRCDQDDENPISAIDWPSLAFHGGVDESKNKRTNENEEEADVKDHLSLFRVKDVRADRRIYGHVRTASPPPNDARHPERPEHGAGGGAAWRSGRVTKVKDGQMPGILGIGTTGRGVQRCENAGAWPSIRDSCESIHVGRPRRRQDGPSRVTVRPMAGKMKRPTTTDLFGDVTRKVFDDQLARLVKKGARRRRRRRRLLQRRRRRDAALFVDDLPHFVDADAGAPERRLFFFGVGRGGGGGGNGGGGGGRLEQRRGGHVERANRTRGGGATRKRAARPTRVRWSRRPGQHWPLAPSRLVLLPAVQGPTPAPRSGRARQQPTRSPWKHGPLALHSHWWTGRNDVNQDE